MKNLNHDQQINFYPGALSCKVMVPDFVNQEIKKRVADSQIIRDVVHPVNKPGVFVNQFKKQVRDSWVTFIYSNNDYKISFLSRKLGVENLDTFFSNESLSFTNQGIHDSYLFAGGIIDPGNFLLKFKTYAETRNRQNGAKPKSQTSRKKG
ncbi:MAG: hypothetical protein LCH54_13820 [Bacteroidetes bacterium]|nr:hypothetical protein [Bacteroidota bacterium]